MRFHSDRHYRRSVRLKGYDYTRSGAYFVTICTRDRECLFGEVVGGEMVLNPYGRIVEWTWHDLPNHLAGIVLDQFVVMPNHVHGVVIIRRPGVGAGSEPAPTTRHGLPEIVRQFRTFSARRINRLRGVGGIAVWQRNYYERVVRNENELNRIREYIANNPRNWALDRDNPIVQSVGRRPRQDEPWRI